MRILFIGGDGYIGSRLCKEFEPFYDITVLSKTIKYNKHLPHICIDINNIDTVTLLQFDVIIFSAHLKTQDFNMFVKKCDKNKQFIYFSTAAIYCNVQNNYIKDKLATEAIIKDYFNHWKILRISTVSGYSPNMRMSLLNSMIYSGREKSHVKIINKDTKKNILWFGDLMEHLKVAIENVHNQTIDCGSFNTTVDELGVITAHLLDSSIEYIDSDKFEYSFNIPNNPTMKIEIVKNIIKEIYNE